MGENGKITYLFGATLPSIVCSPLYPSDIEFQSGEVIVDIHVGDTLRWKISPATHGPKGQKTPHIIIKPTDVGLKTAAVITTDRRRYYIKLISRTGDFNPLMGFFLLRFLVLVT